MKILLTILIFLACNAGATVRYVRSSAAGAADGTTWVNAFTNLSSALTAAAAGDTIYVAHDHAASTNTSVTYTSPGTASSPCFIICANTSAEPPTALATTGSESTSGSSSINYLGFAYVYGLTLSCGTTTGNASHNFNSASAWWWKFERCALRLGGSNGGAKIFVGANNNGAEDDQLLELVNCTVQFAAAGHGIAIRAPFRWNGSESSVTSGTLPTTLLSLGTGASGFAELLGVDLSALGSGKSLVDVSQPNFSKIFLRDCKLGSSFSITIGSHVGQGGAVVDVINSDSADTNYRFYHEDYAGVITHDVSNVRTNGAFDQLTRFSRKMVTSANASFFSPQYSSPVSFFNSTTNTSITLTFNVLTADAVLNNSNMWAEVTYLGTAGFPMAQTVSNRVAGIFTAASNLATNTIAATLWNTNGIANPIAHQFTITLSPPIKQGLISARLACSKASTTNWFDPVIASGIRQYMSPMGVVNDPTTGSYSIGQ